MADVLLNALFAGLAVALVTGPLGSFIVWRRMAYFGDTLAHASLLGVALALLLSINLLLAIIATCLVVAILLVSLNQQRSLASDTLLGILSHSFLALGLVTIALMPDVKVDLLGLLFGDILNVSANNLIGISLASSISIGLLVALWRPLLAITVHEELAKVEGVAVASTRAILMVIIAVLIAIAMKIVGVLLITALLVIPAATARRFAKSPEQMAMYASFIGCMAVCGGLATSWFVDTPAGPSIVLCASALFLIAQMKKITA